VGKLNFSFIAVQSNKLVQMLRRESDSIFNHKNAYSRWAIMEYYGLIGIFSMLVILWLYKRMTTRRSMMEYLGV
jgi:hypothetical protein